MTEQFSSISEAIEAERRYRIFLSYSRDDLHIVQALEDLLVANGFDPMWDRYFGFGRFHEQIRKYIAHADVFLPVLTHSADERKWVHQEIGYAMALNVPVLPVVISTEAGKRLPDQMIAGLQAIEISIEPDFVGQLSSASLDALNSRLTLEEVGRLVQSSLNAGEALFACADYHETRARMFAEYCGDVRTTFRRGGIVRQKGALSSFHIPLETIDHRVWRDRYGGVDRGDQHCSLQREERMALTEHAEAAGCKLIIDPFLTYEKWGEEARRVRLKCLKMFLQGMSDDRCEVAIGRIGTHGASYTYVGNWFAAESMTAISGKGYYQTIFTRHAPSIRKRTALFDAEFSQILREAGVAPQDSRQHAIEEITREIEKIAAVHDGL